MPQKMVTQQLLYRDGKNWTIAHNKGQATASSGTFDIYFGRPSQLDYAMIVSDDTWLSVYDSTLVGPPGRMPEGISNCADGTRNILTVEQRGHAMLSDQTFIMGSSMAHTDQDHRLSPTLCAGHGITCGGTSATLNLRGNEITVQGGHVTRSQEKKGNQICQPGSGLVIREGCHVTVGPGEGISIRAGLIHFLPFELAKQDPGFRVTPKGLYLEGTGEIYDGTFVGESGVYAAERSNLTIFNGKFSNDNSYWAHGGERNDMVTTEALNVAGGSVTIHGGLFEDLFQDIRSCSLFIQEWSSAQVYGGNFHGDWCLGGSDGSYAHLPKVTVYGSNLVMTQDTSRLTGVLCDGSKLDVRLTNHWGPRWWQNDTRTLNLVHDCRHFISIGESMDYHLAKTRTLPVLMIYLLVTGIISVLALVYDKRAWRCRGYKKVSDDTDMEMKSLRPS